MHFFKKIFKRDLSPNQSHSLAVLCGCMALLFGVAVFIGSNNSVHKTLALKNISPTSQAADVWGTISCFVAGCGGSKPTGNISVSTATPTLGTSVTMTATTLPISNMEGCYVYLTGGEYGNGFSSGVGGSPYYSCLDGTDSDGNWSTQDNNYNGSSQTVSGAITTCQDYSSTPSYAGQTNILDEFYYYNPGYGGNISPATSVDRYSPLTPETNSSLSNSATIGPFNQLTTYTLTQFCFGVDSNGYSGYMTTASVNITPVAATSCSNGLTYATYGPSCTCPTGQTQSGSSCTAAPTPTCSITSVTAPATSGGTATINYTTSNTPTSGSVDNSVGSFTPTNPSGALASGPITFTSSAQNITYNMTVTSSGGSGTCSSAIVTIPATTTTAPLCSNASGGGAAGSYPNCSCYGLPYGTSGFTYDSSNNSCTAPLCSDASGGGATGTFPNCTCNTSGYTYDSSTNTCTTVDTSTTPSPSLTFADNPITTGQSTTATWSVTNAASCEVYNFDYNNPVSSALYTDGSTCASTQTTPTPTYSSAENDIYFLYYTDTSGTSYFPTYVLVINDAQSSSCPANSSGTYPDCTCDSGFIGNGQSGSNLVCTANSSTCPANCPGPGAYNCTANNGYTYDSSNNTCTATAASCTFNGNTIPSGNSVTAYQTSTVTSPTTCASQTRTCTNGTLSGSYTYPSCSVAAAATLSTFSASPSRVHAHTGTTASWTGSNLSGCSIATLPATTVNSIGNTANGGSAAVGPISAKTIVTLTCTGLPSQSVTITLIPTIIEI